MAWLLSLLMLLMPLLGQAHNGHTPAAPVMAHEMPCHQMTPPMTPQRHCPHCDEAGITLQCDCCDQAVSPTLPGTETRTAGPVLHNLETPRFDLQARSDPPPTTLYRPPIRL